MPDDITVTISTVKKWLGNPISRNLLRFVAKRDKCGNRLSLAIDYYLGKDINACWKCKLAGKIVGFTISKGREIFGVEEKDIKKGLKETIFKRGLINVLEGIARYGITLPQIVNAPFLVVWDFTHLCNLKCKHCYLDARKRLSDELTTEEAKKLVDELVDAGVVVLAFSGGEPLMRKDFFEIASYAHKSNMYVALATNGTLITEDIAKKLKMSGVEYVEISLDGKDAETHDAFRGVSGMFDRSIRGIKNCVVEGLYTCIATTVTKHNYEQIPEIYDLACDLGVKRFMHFNFIPTMRGVGIAKEDITPEQREKLLQFLLERNYDGKVEALSTAPQFARVAVDKRGGISLGHFYADKKIEDKTMVLAEFIGGCGAGRLYCCVEPNGDVQPCVFMPIKVGNIREKSFLEIWHNSPVLKKLRDRSLLKGHCAKCENKFICGGCRARAWAYFNDLCAPDPGCINNKEAYERLVIK